MPATPVFADAVEDLARDGASPRDAAAAAGFRSRAGRRRPLILGVVRRLSRSRRFGAWFIDEEERRARAWRGEKAQERAAFRRANLDPEARAEAEKTMRSKRTAS